MESPLLARGPLGFAFTVLLIWPSALVGADGWESLFNGRDLSGWVQSYGDAPFTVENGAIVGTTRSNSPGGFLVTDQEFDDFIFEAEFRFDRGFNSGINFRSQSRPDLHNGSVYGYQCEIDPGPRAWTAGIYEQHLRGWLYPVELNPSAKTEFRQQDWNHLRIEAIGPSMRTWLNGVPVAHVIDNDSAKGIFGLQIHAIRGDQEGGDRIYFRNLRVKTENLQPAPLRRDLMVINLLPNRLSEAESRQGWELLWDGQTPRGWRSVRGSGFPSQGWRIADGALTVVKPRGGDIVTDRTFRAFDLQVEYKLTPAANSGIKYAVPPGSNVGLEYQLLDDSRNPDAKEGEGGNRTLASLYDLFPSARTVSGHRVPIAVGKWQRARIVVHPDGRVEHWLNGMKVLDYERGSAAFREQVARSKFAGREDFGLVRDGHILLQEHDDQVSFRSIKVRRLE